jgi:hypothetical protein
MAGEYPARVLLFELIDGEGERVMGLSAYWMGDQGSWISVLGLTTARDGQPEFYSMVKNAR